METSCSTSELSSRVCWISIRCQVSSINGNKAVQMDKLPAERLPTPAELKVLQCHSGEFNWLATRTRLDLSYYTSLLASSCSKHADWSLDLAKKILRFLAGTKDQGIVISVTGSLSDLVAWSDAGYAGADTRSQSGLIIMWGGSILSWRSSRQTVPTVNSRGRAQCCYFGVADY